MGTLNLSHLLPNGSRWERFNKRSDIVDFHVVAALLCQIRSHVIMTQWTTQRDIACDRPSLSLFGRIADFIMLLCTGVRARGLGAAAPLKTRAKPLFFGQKLIFRAEASSQI